MRTSSFDYTQSRKSAESTLRRLLSLAYLLLESKIEETIQSERYTPCFCKDICGTPDILLTFTLKFCCRHLNSSKKSAKCKEKRK